MTDEAKISCNGLGVVKSDRVRPTPKGWREGPLPAYDRCPGCADCPPTAAQVTQARIAAIEARVRAEVAGQAVEAIESVRRRYAAMPFDRFVDTSPADMVNDCIAAVTSLAAGSSPDTTPEPKP